MSHDSRGALLKKGDRVLVEGILTEDPSADGGYCNAHVKFVTPEQRDPPPMSPPNDTFNTRMLTKVGTAAVVLLLMILPAVANAWPWNRGNVQTFCSGPGCKAGYVQSVPVPVVRQTVPVRRSNTVWQQAAPVMLCRPGQACLPAPAATVPISSTSPTNGETGTEPGKPAVKVPFDDVRDVATMPAFPRIERMPPSRGR